MKSCSTRTSTRSRDDLPTYLLTLPVSRLTLCSYWHHFITRLLIIALHCIYPSIYPRSNVIRSCPTNQKSLIVGLYALPSSSLSLSLSLSFVPTCLLTYLVVHLLDSFFSFLFFWGGGGSFVYLLSFFLSTSLVFLFLFLFFWLVFCVRYR